MLIKVAMMCKTNLFFRGFLSVVKHKPFVDDKIIIIKKKKKKKKKSSLGAGSLVNRFSFCRYDKFFQMLPILLYFAVYYPLSFGMFLTEIGMKWHEQKILLYWLPIYCFLSSQNTPTAIINHCPQSGTCVN